MFERVGKLGFILLVYILSSVLGEDHDGKLSVPDIFVIGAAKAGSTTLDAMLAIHPEVCNGTAKEIHYFDAYWERGDSWYTDQFSIAGNCVGKRYTLDASPTYISREWVPNNVKQAYHPSELAKKKFLLILRDPVSREFSWYNHMLRACLPVMEKFVQTNQPKSILFKATNKTILGYAKNDICGPHCQELGCGDIPAKSAHDLQRQLYTFDEYAAVRADIVREGSAYANQIRNWLRVIKREQLFILGSHTLSADPTDSMRRIAQFLDLSTDWGENVALLHKNGGWDRGAYISCRVHDRLQEYYDPLNQDLYELVRDAHDKPPSEPLLTPFPASRQMCKDV